MLKCNWKKNENNHLQSDWYRWDPRQKNVIKSLANRINSQVTIGRKLNLPVIHRCSAAKNDHHSNKCSGEQGREHMCPIVPVPQSGHIWDSGYGGPDQLDNKNAPMIQLKLIPPIPVSHDNRLRVSNSSSHPLCVRGGGACCHLAAVAGTAYWVHADKSPPQICAVHADLNVNIWSLKQLIF